jgi:sortase (surface protein transpeptidase)
MKSDRKNKNKRSSSKGSHKKTKQQRTQRTQRKMTKRQSRKSSKSRKSKKRQNGGECEYLKVQGVDLPDLKIPEQYALLNESCEPSGGANNAVLHGHPNMTA